MKLRELIRCWRIGKRMKNNKLELWLKFLQPIIIIAMILLCIYFLTKISNERNKTDSQKLDKNLTKYYIEMNVTSYYKK